MRMFAVAFDTCLTLALVAVLGWLMLGCAAAPVPVFPDAAPAPTLAREFVDSKGRACVSRLPLTVRSDATLRYKIAAELALTEWRRATGLEVGRVVSGPDADVTIVFLACPPDLWREKSCKHLAQVHQECVDGVLRQEVQVFSLGDDVQLMVHELGHAIGVDSGGDVHGHNENEASIMFRAPDISKGRILPSDVAGFRRTWGLARDLL